LIPLPYKPKKGCSVNQGSLLFYTNFMSKVGGGLMFFLMDWQGNQFDASSIVVADPAFFPTEAQKK